MTQVMKTDLPWPPSVNNYWHHNRRGQVFLSAKGKEFREVCMQNVPLFHDCWESERVLLKVRAVPPDKRRRDLDNILKAILDGLEAARVFADDSQVKILDVQMLEPKKPGRVYVEVSTIDDEIGALKTAGAEGTTV